MKLIQGRNLVWKTSAQRLKVSVGNQHLKIELLNRNSLTLIFQIYIPMKNEGKKHSVPGQTQMAIPMENQGERKPLVNSATSLCVRAQGRTVPAIAPAVLIWGDFRYFHALSFVSLNHSSLFSILSISEVESTIFSLLQIRDSRTGILRLKPSEIFWFLIQRRVKNSNARKGLGLSNPQRLRTHSVAANRLGYPEPWACASAPRDAFFCYTCS